MEPTVLSLRSQAELKDDWLTTRLATVVPEIMERAGIDCWVLVAREYNEDPVVATMLPATWLNARRRTVLVFSSFGAERIAISRYAVGTAFPAGWDPDQDPDQWHRLADYLVSVNPQRIGINRSDVFALADGMSANEYSQLLEALPAALRERVTPTHDLAIGWLETRTPEEMQHYPDVCSRAHELLRRALSAEVITPGQTTTTDVEWWLRQQTDAAGYGAWFHPTVSVQRRTELEAPQSFSAKPAGVKIEPGDLVHIDFGIVYLGLHTDQQQHGYVLRPGETDAPAGLKAGLLQANELQDLVMSEFATGRSGNEVLEAAHRAAAAAGIDAAIYSHPIGLHGHGAGPTIGLWDQQAGVSGAGDYPLWPNTTFSIELSTLVAVAEWDEQLVRIMLEEEAFFDGQSCRFMDGRQTRLWLI